MSSDDFCVFFFDEQVRSIDVLHGCHGTKDILLNFVCYDAIGKNTKFCHQMLSPRTTIFSRETAHFTIAASV